MSSNGSIDSLKSKVLSQQENACANCGIDFSEDYIPKFRYLLPPEQGGDLSEENVEALCVRCFNESGSEGV